MNILLISLGLSLLIQLLFFVPAYFWKTDKLTDLSYGLTFIMLTLISLGRNSEASSMQIILTVTIVVWGLRLISYLLYRILKIKKDSRFDEMRNSLLKFGSFFLFQGVSVWLIMIPSILFLGKNIEDKWNWISLLGLMIWAIALIIETIADLQQFQFRSKKENRDKFISSGIWRYSRHPNYFGEMMCWWGLFIYTLPYLRGWEFLGIIGPTWISFLLLFVSGIPILEKKNDERYGNNKEYQEYKRRTSLLVIWPFKKIN